MDLRRAGLISVGKSSSPTLHLESYSWHTQQCSTVHHLAWKPTVDCAVVLGAHGENGGDSNHDIICHLDTNSLKRVNTHLRPEQPLRVPCRKKFAVWPSNPKRNVGGTESPWNSLCVFLLLAPAAVTHLPIQNQSQSMSHVHFCSGLTNSRKGKEKEAV